MKDYLKKDEINILIKNNEDLKEGYEFFKKSYSRYPIIDMYASTHMWKPIVEVTIKFMYGDNIYYYKYYHEYGEEPIIKLKRVSAFDRWYE